ncbi:MAG: bacillithiol biosynthesis deacetylase BshB1 [Sediminibacterium sp.]|nr:bacillithiol biosynthesis deacetylase BshB1 [Sediminibacterium sp.]
MIDILAIGIHPDDIELSVSGTLLKEQASGKRIGLLDLSRGELGTRGSVEIRTQEANAAAKLLNAAFRVQLNLRDGFFENNEANLIPVIEQIREHRPAIVLTNAPSDRHPDHGRASKLIADACFYSGLLKIKTTLNGTDQQPWRPKAVYQYIQDQYIHPDFVIDISEYMEKKLEVILCYASQFFNPDSKEPVTPISSKEFLESVKAKNVVWGRAINTAYAEGFKTLRYPGVNSLSDLI